MKEGAGWTIVVMDDEPDIREVIAMSLQDEGYRVLSASDGESGLRLCREHAVQIVLTDIRMPVMDGIQVLKALKSERPEIEVIVATAFGEMQTAILALQHDASDFITKPIGQDALAMALKRARHRYTTRKQIIDYTALLEHENAKTSQELLANLTFQKNLIESAMDGIVGVEPGGSVRIFNHAMEKLLSENRVDVIGKLSLAGLFAPGAYERFMEDLESERHGGKNRLALYETQLMDGAGKPVPVQVSAVVLPDATDGPGIVCYFRDLRDLRRLEQELADQTRILHQDKMMSLGRLAASVVHEINNPLAGILNYIRLMMRRLEKPLPDPQSLDKVRKDLDVVFRETERCSKIVSNLLLFSRKSEPVFSEVDIRELIDRCMLLSGHKLEMSRIQWAISLAADLPRISGDMNQLQQALINLIFNAIDAMPAGGKLQIEARTAEDEHAVALVVSDTGTGISPADMPHIFEPFFSTKAEGYGVGLGLSTVYGIVERHGGKIDVESTPGAGTTFTLRLPVRMSVKT
ncbi:hybrid sensor histidine kinase/response regulator [Desulfatirhabdium butyrativorans]|uniref:hybrid sensor histidine kinase/response regulator n=1 Tax=Desulfatirhabdium butyrativorans TaxID=340467 RepID=UPI0003F6DC8D|nr:ATP-binding protein [Desulfatirhabdium butyrativorans]